MSEKPTSKINELTRAIYISITEEVFEKGLLTQKEYDKAIAEIMRL